MTQSTVPKCISQNLLFLWVLFSAEPAVKLWEGTVDGSEIRRSPVEVSGLSH